MPVSVGALNFDQFGQTFWMTNELTPHSATYRPVEILRKARHVGQFVKFLPGSLLIGSKAADEACNAPVRPFFNRVTVYTVGAKRLNIWMLLCKRGIGRSFWRDDRSHIIKNRHVCAFATMAMRTTAQRWFQCIVRDIGENGPHCETSFVLMQIPWKLPLHKTQ